MNKFTFLLTALVIGSLSANAQTSSGNMMIGGGLEFDSRTYQDKSRAEQSTISFSPGFGYFIGDNFAVGTTLTFTSTTAGVPAATKTKTSTFALGPFARYYIFTSNERFGFFGQAQLDFGFGTTNPPAGSSTRNSFISFALSPGAAFFFNEHWAIEFAIRGFVITSVDPDKDNDIDRYSTTELGLTSLSPNLGFRYHF
jgi:hypothetical protein